MWTFFRSFEVMCSLTKFCGCVLLLFVFTQLHAATPAGLKFKGNSYPIDERTSFDVFGDQTVNFAERFDIRFNLSLFPASEFGYIVRIKNSNSDRIYHLFYDGQGGNAIFKLNEEGKSSLIVATLERQDLPHMDWFSVKISFDLKNDSIKLQINDQSFSANSENLPDSYQPIVLFGKSDHFIDVPSFAIKDLAIGQKQEYFFALNESKGAVVHTPDGDVYGKVINPEWLVNDAYHWRHKASLSSTSVAGANYNSEKKEIYYFNKDSLHVLNMRSGSVETKVFDQPNPVRLVLGTNFIDNTQDKLYSYETYSDDYSGPTVACLDLNSLKWQILSSQQLPSPLHHHGSYFDPSTEAFTIFGGFGRMRYSKDFYSFDLNENHWDTLSGFSGDVLTPRYFSSVGYLKETNSIYVFGGMGNESGEQTVGRKYYYDLYKVELNTKRITKLWEIPWPKDNVVPVRGMVILNDSSFYTLCYPEHMSESLLRLYRFSLKDGSYQILGDSIRIHSDKITTNANLYYDNTLNSLYAVVQEFDDDIASTLNVYSISFPPLTADELATYPKERKNYATALTVSAIIMGIGLLFLFYMKIRPRRTRDSQIPPHITEQSVPIGEIVNDITKPVARANSIYLFGEFTVHDRKNRDITYMFSAQLKQIFCLILQYTTVNNGIASQRLSNILWPDRPSDKVKNLRGVTLNHLRKVLSELDGIELVYDKGHFKIEQANAFYCDYVRLMEIISFQEINKHRGEMLEILSRGKFLQLSDHPLYDSFKEELEKKLEPVLIVEMEKSFDAELYETTIAFAEAIFNIDPLNDTAFSYQIKAMQKLKLNDEARIRYQAFVIEYRKIMGSDYLHPYK